MVPFSDHACLLGVLSMTGLASGLAACSPATAGPTPIPAQPTLSASVPVVDTREPPAPAHDEREARTPWRTLPKTAAELERFMADVCTATHSEDDAKEAARFAEDHLPPNKRAVAGHYRRVATLSEVSQVTLDGGIAKRRIPLCDASREFATPRLSGNSVWVPLTVEGQPFEMLVTMADDTARLERLSLILGPSTERRPLARVPEHVPVVHVDDLTNTDEGRNAAKIIRAATVATLCIDHHVVAQENEATPNLTSFSVTVGLGDGSLGPEVSVFADAEGVSMAFMRCLTGGLRDQLTGFPRLTRLPKRFPELAERPLTRIRFLIPLKQDEVEGDVLIMGAP